MKDEERKKRKGVCSRPVLAGVVGIVVAEE